jgi:hypothetical protein
LGKELTVQGIIDGEAMNRIRDLDDGPLTPVDFELSQESEIRFGGGGSSASGNELDEYRPYTHLLPDNVLIAPYEIVREMGGSLRSIAVGFADGAEA